MFDSIGWAEILVLVVAALFILGPERLPQAASWLGRNTRKVREFATGARAQLREEVGPEFDEFRQPLQDLRSLRHADPKRTISHHLFDDDTDPLGLREDVHSNPERTEQTPTTPEEDDRTPSEKPSVDPEAT